MILNFEEFQWTIVTRLQPTESHSDTLPTSNGRYLHFKLSKTIINFLWKNFWNFVSSGSTR